MELTKHVPSNLDRDLHRSANTKIRYLTIGLGGFLYGIIFTIFLPGFLNPDLSRLPAAVVLPTKVLLRAANWPWSLASCAVMMILIIAMGSQRNLWSLAFAVGALLGSLAVKALSHLG